jgi:hypothetical protein
MFWTVNGARSSGKKSPLCKPKRLLRPALAHALHVHFGDRRARYTSKCGFQAFANKKERKSRHNLNSAASIRLMSMSPQPRDGSQKSCWRFSRCLNRHGRANRNPHSAVIQSNYPVWSVLKTSRNAEMKKTRTGKDRSAEALAHALYVTFAVGKQVIMP